MKYENTKLDKRLKKKFQFEFAKASQKKTAFVKKAPQDAPKVEEAGEKPSDSAAPVEKA